MDMLQTIMAERRADVETAKRKIPAGELRDQAQNRTHHSLTDKLARRAGTCVIAEMKKASPSAGVLSDDYRPADIARNYMDAGAAGISVLTEPRHFLGNEQDLRMVRKTVDLPVLRKDFICDPYQLDETAAWGGDVVLLIAAALAGGVLTDLYEQALDLKLDVLIEIHSAAELETALACERAIIGVNSRDLSTLKTDLTVAKELAARIPAQRLSIAESGIKTRRDIAMLEKLGYNGFLVGETLMRSSDPAKTLRALIG